MKTYRIYYTEYHDCLVEADSEADAREIFQRNENDPLKSEGAVWDSDLIDMAITDIKDVS